MPRGADQPVPELDRGREIIPAHRRNLGGADPWSAADAPVGLLRADALISLARSGSGGTRADAGVRPTSAGHVLSADSFPTYAYHVRIRGCCTNLYFITTRFRNLPT